MNTIGENFESLIFHKPLEKRREIMMSLLELATKLVSFNTVTFESSSTPMGDFIASLLADNKFSIQQYPFTDTKGLKKVNIVATKGNVDQKPRLAFAGHMDTVNMAAWDAERKGTLTDPLRLTYFNKKYYGRGIADMKLALAAFILAGISTPESELKHPLRLCFTSDEEFGCLGAKRLMKEMGKPLAEFVVVGEPTEMKPVYAHKGYLIKTFTLVAEVLSAHSSHPKNGTDLISTAVPKLLFTLDEIKRKLEQIRDMRFDPPYPTMNVGKLTTDGEVRPIGKKETIIVKSAKNFLPGYCYLECEVRTIPGQDVMEINSIIERLVSARISIPKGEVRIDENIQRAPSIPMETPINSLLIKTVKEISGQSPQTAPYNTEGGLYNKYGSQSVIWGPGSIKQAHTSIEYVDEKFISQKTVDMYINLIRRMCC